MSIKSQNLSEISVDIMIGAQPVKISTGLFARQANGAVTVRQGDTMLLVAATAASAPRDGIDYFPLQVEYRERFSAAGRFPGGFFKREGRPSEKEILTARFTDRPIRPLFAKGYRNDVQVVCQLLTADNEFESDILSVLGASAALTLSELPFFGPIGCVRVGRINGQFVLNPTHTERAKSDFDMVYAGLRDNPVMIEGGATEITEQEMLAAMRFAHAACVELIDAQLKLRKLAGLPEKIVQEGVDADPELLAAAMEICGPALSEAYLIPGKKARHAAVGAIEAALRPQISARFPEINKEQFRATFDALVIQTVRDNVLRKGRRIDGRRFDEVRPCFGAVGILPRVHGSAFFARGETQSLGTVTLGSGSDTQDLDAITGGPVQKAFMVHYNFPPYSVGETGRMSSPGRREIGHGALAERSLEEVMPKDYPYTVRMVSDIQSSNGSTSMASVCVGTLALLDAGVPLRKPVAGISCGLFTAPDKTEMVVDILGDEDHCGDMDFKVAGTRDGITGFQVDFKIHGLPWPLVEKAFEMTRVARLEILEYMATILPAARTELSPFAPRIQVIKIPQDKIGELIGPGGKNIRRITELTGAKIDIEEDGSVKIFSADKKSLELAVREVTMITAEAEEGKIYNGVVVGIKPFGCFVEIFPGRDGMVHISELADFRVNVVEEVCKMGDQMWVKCIGVDDRGRIKLSRRAAMAELDAKAKAGGAPQA